MRPPGEGRALHDGSPILVVDSDDSSRLFLGALLRGAGYPTVEEANGEDALAAARSVRPALALVEVELPGMSGYHVCRQLRDEFGEILPIVFIAGTRTTSLDHIAGFSIGADDYLVKPVVPEELLARIRRLLVRSAAAGTPFVLPAGKDGLSLSPREKDVLHLLAEGLTNKAIGQTLFISPKTVASHVQRILSKLGVRNRAEAVVYAHRHGLVRGDPNMPLVGARSSPAP